MISKKTLLIGPSGTGKTFHCIERFKEALRDSKSSLEPDIWLVLPSQEHVHRITDLLLRQSHQVSLGVLFNRRILTINDFVLRLREKPRGELVSEVTQIRLIREILEGGRLPYLARLKEHKGSFYALLDLIRELKESLVTGGALARAIRPLVEAKDPRAQKLQELSLLYEKYERELKKRKLSDQEGEMWNLLRSLDKRPPSALRGARQLIFDGFFHFTPSQEELITRLSQKVPETTVTFTHETGEERSLLFETPGKSFSRLKSAGFVVEALPKHNYRTRSRSLMFLEEQFSRENVVPQESAGGDITILEASGFRGEMEMVAREIRRLVTRGGYHWSDFAVIVRTVDPYEAILRSIFERYEIPSEVHERKWLAQNALVKSVMTFLRIFKEGWRRSEILGFLRSSYGPFDPEEIAKLEEEVLRLGILDGKESWLQSGEKGQADSLKKRVSEELLFYENEFREVTRFEDFADLIKKAGSKFGWLVHGFREDEKTREDLAAWRVLEKILDERAQKPKRSGKSSSGLSFEDCFAFLEQAIEIALFPFKQKGKNRVQVYDVSLARQKEYRVVFLCGLVEKMFPMEIREDPLLRDEDRRFLQGRGLRLEERLLRRSTERYLFYLGVTRAEERLFLSYPKYDAGGHEALPSFYLDEVKQCFREISGKRIDISEVMPPLKDLSSGRETEDYVIFHFWERRPRKAFPLDDLSAASELYNRLLVLPGFVELVKGASQKSGRVTDARILDRFRLFREPVSVTKLEDFGKCPFRFFAKHVLKLPEVREGIDEREIGRILHEVLYRFFKEAPWDANEEHRITEENAGRLRPVLSEKLSEELAKAELRGDLLYRIELRKRHLARLLDRFLDQEAAVGGKRGLVASDFERSFGGGGGSGRSEQAADGGSTESVRAVGSGRSEQAADGGSTESVRAVGSGLPFLKIPFEDGSIRLTGRIDRIDTDRSGKRALVVDYKLKQSFELKDLYDGTALQLPLYAVAARELLGLDVVGAELYPLEKLKRKGFYRKSAVEKLIKGRTSGAQLTEGEFEEVLERSKEFVREYIRRIRAGDVATEPKLCEKYCAYHQVCRIEKWRIKYLELERKRDDRKEHADRSAERSGASAR